MLINRASISPNSEANSSRYNKFGKRKSIPDKKHVYEQIFGDNNIITTKKNHF